MGGRSGGGNRAVRRGPRAAGSAAAFAFGLMFLAEGAAPATSPAWTGTVYTSTVTSSVGCAHAVRFAATAFSTATGRGTFGEGQSVAPCGRAPPGWNVSNASWTADWEAVLDLPTLTSHARTFVNVSWRFNWSVLTTYTLNRSCGGTLAANATYGVLTCTVAAAVSWESFDLLWDATSNVFYGASSASFPSLYNSSWATRTTTCTPRCTTYRAATGPQGNRTGTLNATFRFILATPNPSHVWYLVAYTSASAYASVDTRAVGFAGVRPMMASAADGIDLGRGSNGAQLLAVVVT